MARSDDAVVDSPRNPQHSGNTSAIQLRTRRPRRWIIGTVRFSRGIASLAIPLVVLGALYLRYFGIQVEQVLSPADVRPVSDVAYKARVPRGMLRYFCFFPSDGDNQNSRSQLRLFENGVQLGPSHTVHSSIAGSGRGSYSHWGELILFSASDNSDPRTNGRAYALASQGYLSAFWFAPVIGVGLLFGCVFWIAQPVRRWWGDPDAAVRGRAPATLMRGGLHGTIAAAAGLLLIAMPALAHGAVFWLLLGVAIVFALLTVRNVALGGLLLFGRDKVLASLQNAALTIAAISVSLAAFELYLALAEASAVHTVKASDAHPRETPVENRDAKGTADGTLRIRSGRAEIVLPPSLGAMMQERRNLITMPTDWELQPVTVPSATAAYRWQGVLHVFDQDNYRRLNGPFPPKDPNLFRILVAGDSITYGAGIEETWGYPAQLQRLLEKDYRVEVINLGRNGDQSEDILRSIEKMAPVLKPDLIIYGVCLNDFLPSGIGQYNYTYSVPIPQWLKTTALERTRLAHLFDDAYQALLLALHVRQDFFDDVLSNFGDHQNRFGADLNRMSEFAFAQGLAPIVGLVLDQYPSYGGRGQRMATVAETYMTKAKFDLISAEDYYRSYDGRQLYVSRWEGHPDEQAQAIFATRIADHLYGRSDLERYRR